MPDKGPTIEYGEYLANITCSACHGPDFRGAPPIDPESPPAPGLTTVAAWPAEDFARAVREGVAPDGRQYHEVMPYTAFTHMTDDEITALRSYFGTLIAGAEPTGS
jgi:mono/diheme cytochrome c family protein